MITYMTELDKIRVAVNDLNARLRREEGYQVERMKLPCTCACHKRSQDVRAVDTEIYRLQANLAEIRTALSVSGCNQDTTMRRVRLLVERSGKFIIAKEEIRKCLLKI